MIHSASVDAQAGDVIEVYCQRPATLHLMSRRGFLDYREGRGFDSYQWDAANSPGNVVIPHSGEWQLVAEVNAAARATVPFRHLVIPAAVAERLARGDALIRG
jgi:hypothetical protein